MSLINHYSTVYTYLYIYNFYFVKKKNPQTKDTTPVLSVFLLNDNLKVIITKRIFANDRRHAKLRNRLRFAEQLDCFSHTGLIIMVSKHASISELIGLETSIYLDFAIP